MINVMQTANNPQIHQKHQNIILSITEVQLIVDTKDGKVFNNCSSSILCDNGGLIYIDISDISNEGNISVLP